MITSPSAFWTAAGVMFLAGIGIPIMAALNGGLGKGLGNPVAATAVAFAVGLICSLAALTAVGLPPLQKFSGIALPNYLGAVFVVFYVLSVTYFAPRIGLGNAIFFVLLGQLVAAAVIDHWGLLGAVRFGLTWRRFIGILVMAVGVWLAKRTG